ncbi:hypothetical protein TNCV_3125241 [Trichonephila clavipes]|nr:hypothetical protein TNCV_3125241 [Trichonephila clavipes]
MQQQVIVTGIVRRCGRVGHNTAITDGRMINPISVLQIPTFVWPRPSTGSSSSPPQLLSQFSPYKRGFRPQCSMIICRLYAAYYYPSEFVGRIWQHPLYARVGA